MNVTTHAPRLVGRDPYNATAMGGTLAYRLGPHYRSRVVLGPPWRLLPRFSEEAVSYEDPRLWASPDGPRLVVTTYGRDGLGDYTRLWTCGLDGRGAVPLSFPGQRRVEKNWLPFCADGGTWLSYSMQQGMHVTGQLRADGSVRDVLRAPFSLPWDHGDVRGGSPPVARDGLMWTFFHSTRWDKRTHYFEKDYVMGCAAFEPRPPFRVVGLSPGPLWRPAEARLVAKKWVMRVVFPGSAEVEGGGWLVTCGLNDCAVVQLRFSHAELEENMVW